MVKGSYKPREGQLQPTPVLREFFMEHFKGVKAKPLRMSGDMFDSVNTFITAIHGKPDLEDNEHRSMLLNIVNAFRRTMETKDPVVKKRRYETGYSKGKFQIMLTHSTYPVPHLPWAGITLITMDVGIPGADKQLIKFVCWENCFSHDVCDSLVSFYGHRVKPSVSVDNNLSECLVDMIFEMVAPPRTFTEMSTLVESIKAA